jgi:hypothetical protein
MKHAGIQPPRRLRAIGTATVGALLFLFSLASITLADEALVEKSLSQISDNRVSALGQRALQIHTNDWKHSETEHFVYHYFNSFVATPVAVESEFYYRVIAKELDKDTAQWERKCQIFIFETDDDWHEFQKAGGLEPWTGGIHAQGELFIQRNPQKKFKGDALAHEITHLVVHRFFGSGIPRWLDEGLAEYTATRWYASFWRARGYLAHPRSHTVGPESYIRLNDLTSMVSYPAQEAQVIAFYFESERLVRFLEAADKQGFLKFLDAMCSGNRFDTALEKGFGSKFYNADALEQQFKPYAAKEHTDPAS